MNGQNRRASAADRFEQGKRMNSLWVRSAAILFAVSSLCSMANTASAQSTTAATVIAANTFLATLDVKQRQNVLYAFDDQQQRRRWWNFPTAVVRRGGLSMRELNVAQRNAVFALLSASLSARGYEKVQQIMEGDEVLNQSEGGGRMFGKDLYFISILGKPSEREPWMLQFGGHHLALNLTMAADRGFLTPTLTGAQPSKYVIAGKTVRPLGQESDKAFALLSSLDDSQRKQAILRYRVGDLVLGPGQDGKTIQPEGLQASAMTERQRAMLLDVISEWAGIVGGDAAVSRMAEIKAGLNETWFAWSGSTDVRSGDNVSAYYRIQGPKLVIEYAPQGRDATHVHTMYRDPTNDYGRSLTAK